MAAAQRRAYAILSFMTDALMDTPRRDRPRKKSRKGLIAILIALLLFIGAIVFIAWSLFGRLGDIETIDNAFPEESLRPAAVEPPDGEDAPLNILLLGSDTRADTSTSLLSDIGSRADTIMVAHIPSDRESVQIMSIMRDSWVEIPGHGNAKVNAAMAYGGVPLMVQTVEGLIDQRIDHVAVADFNGFKNITDALGGVTVNNPRAFTASSPVNIPFEAGQITLNGDEALAFVRERKSFSDGDYTRVANQQLFLQSMAGQVLSRETMTNPSRLSDLIGATTPYVALDNELGLTKMIQLGSSMSSTRASDISSFTMPTNGTGREGGGQSVVYVDWDELENVRTRFAEDDLVGYEPAAY